MLTCILANSTYTWDLPVLRKISPSGNSFYVFRKKGKIGSYIALSSNVDLESIIIVKSFDLSDAVF